MRTSTAYFAGVGTVVLAIGVGLGGGYLAANIAHPPVPAVSKLERRTSAEPTSVSVAPAQATSSAQEQQAQSSQPQMQPVRQIEAAAPTANTSRAEEKTTAAQPAPLPSKPAEQAEEKTAAPRDSYARANDGDIKRAAVEKRRAERRQQRAEKRGWKQPREQQPREQEIDAVEDRVREVTEPRRIRIREDGEPRGFFGESGRRDVFAEPARGQSPRIRLFDQND